MATFLFSDLVFGPVISRRLGVSLGINLLPTDCKVCNYNCIYCECGWTMDMSSRSLPKADEILFELEQRLLDMQSKAEHLDVITFAGNGEPTMHPQFADIVNGVIELRNRFYNQARVVVLSNATLAYKPSVYEALSKIDDNILKLDSAIPATLQLLNKPIGIVTPEKITSSLMLYKQQFILQTMFLKGEYEGKQVDNTTKNEIEAWLKVISQTEPRKIMIYSLARDTPAKGLIKLSVDELEIIANQARAIGYEVQVAG